MNPQTPLLARLREHGIADAGQCARLERLEQEALPWWLRILQALGAWTAAFWIREFSEEIIDFVIPKNYAFQGQLALALILAGMALWLFARRAGSVFFTSLALGLSLGGQGTLGMAFGMGRPWPNLLLALALTLPRTGLLHRGMCLLAALFCLEVGLAASLNPVRPLVITLWLALALALWLTRQRWALWPRRGAWLHALAHATSIWGLGGLLLYHADLSFGWELLEVNEEALDAARQYARHQMAALLVWLGCAFWLLRQVARPRQRHLLLGAAAALGLLAYNAPALLLSLALMLASFRACQRAWVFFSLAALWGFFALFYYNMQHSLLLKSLSLALLGGGLLGLHALLSRADARAPGEAP